MDAAQSRNFSELVRYYYSITPEVPPELASRRIAHALAEQQIAEFILEESGVAPGGRLLDAGCSSGGLLVAANARFASLTGVDVALRWLVIGQQRLREAGVAADLVCANAEALPFPGESFDLLTAIDLLEHLRDAPAALQEMHRVIAPGSTVLLASNNRFALTPDPQVGLFGVGWLRRAWQPGYVAARRKGLHRYHVRMRSARECRRMLTEAGFKPVVLMPAGLTAPHLPGLASALRAYNRLIRLPGTQAAALWFGPRYSLRAGKGA